MYGFIGLGHMGGPIASRIVDDGHDMLVWDRAPHLVEALVAEGAMAAAAAAEISERAETCFICVLDDAQTTAVVEELLDARTADSTLRNIVVHSTVLPATVIKLGELAGRFGIGVIDAPVSGDQEARQSGNLTVMVGGTDDQFEAQRPVLSAYASTIVHAGPLGSGSALKLGNQILSIVGLLTTIEALRFTKAHSIPEDVFTTVIRVSTGDNYSARNLDFFDEFAKLRTPSGGDALYEILQKDLKAALEAARDARVSLPLVLDALANLPDVYSARWLRGQPGALNEGTVAHSRVD